MTWFEQAACPGLDPELFFPGRGDHITVRNAKAVCATCPVTAECLTYSRNNTVDRRPTPGIWGGLSERERRATRQGRRYQPPWWERHPDKAAWAHQLRAEGAAQGALAAELGMSRDSIRTWLDRTGDPLPHETRAAS